MSSRDNQANTMNSQDKNLFCVLHGPYVADEPTRWKIIHYAESMSSAIKYSISISDGVSVGDMIAVVFIDDITSLQQKSQWLGIAHTNKVGLPQVIQAPYGSDYIYGRFWFDAYEDKYDASHLFYLIRNIDKRRLVKIMMECVLYTFRNDKRINGEYADRISEIIEWTKGSDIKDEKSFKDSLKSSYWEGIKIGEDLLHSLESVCELMMSKRPDHLELFGRFCSDLGCLTDDINESVSEIIKAEVPMPVAILSNIGEHL